MVIGQSPKKPNWKDQQPPKNTNFQGSGKQQYQYHPQVCEMVRHQQSTAGSFQQINDPNLLDQAETAQSRLLGIQWPRDKSWKLSNFHKQDTV